MGGSVKPIDMTDFASNANVVSSCNFFSSFLMAEKYFTVLSRSYTGWAKKAWPQTRDHNSVKS